MLFIDLFVMLMAFALIMLLVTEVVAPLTTGEPLFPHFRRSVVRSEIVKAEHALEEVAEVSHLKQVVSEVQRRAAELEKKE